MQINRLFETVYLLMEKKSMTAKELAEHFEVSKRTILRDVETLSMAGIPVYTSQGKGGGIAIHDRYVLNKAVITEDEQKEILFALQSVSATQNKAADGVLTRLRSLFEKTDKDWIQVDFSRWGNSTEDKAKFEILRDAILGERSVSFTYSGASGDTTERTVYPLKLVFKSQAWYLQAFCRLKNDYRVFKISRIRNAEALPAGFDGKQYQAPNIEASENQFSRFVDLKLRFAPQAAFRVYDEFDDASVTKNDDGSFTAEISLPDEGWLYSYIITFGTAVTVLEPQSVRDAIVMLADEIKSKYSSKT